MTNVTEPTPKRQYDAQASRQALLDAAAELFDDRGYERATIREIGERAGVDPALIARYFGGKEGLYRAVLADPDSHRPITCVNRDPALAVGEMLRHWDTRGSTPLRRALISADLTPEVRDQIGAILQTHLLGPLSQELARRGTPDAALRAEIAVAVATGVTLLRTNGLVPELGAADLDTIIAVIEPLLGRLDQP